MGKPYIPETWSYGMFHPVLSQLWKAVPLLSPSPYTGPCAAPERPAQSRAPSKAWQGPGVHAPCRIAAGSAVTCAKPRPSALHSERVIKGG